MLVVFGDDHRLEAPVVSVITGATVAQTLSPPGEGAVEVLDIDEGARLARLVGRTHVTSRYSP